VGAPSDVAVVITAHNYGHFLPQCLQSVQSQTVLPREVLVIDDASDDQTAAVMRGFDGVRYFRVDFRNGNRARNFGFARISCPLVVFFDADNYMAPQFVETLHRALEQDAEAVFAYGDRINFADGDVSWYPHPMGVWQSGAFDPARLRKHNYIDLAALVRAERFPGFDPELRRYQDWDLWLNVAAQGGYGRYVPQPLFYYRVHGNSLSFREDRDRAAWYLRRKYRIGWGAWPLLRHSFGLYRLARWVKSAAK